MEKAKNLVQNQEEKTKKMEEIIDKEISFQKEMILKKIEERKNFKLKKREEEIKKTVLKIVKKKKMNKKPKTTIDINTLVNSIDFGEENFNLNDDEEIPNDLMKNHQKQNSILMLKIASKELENAFLLHGQFRCFFYLIICY